MNNRWIQLSKLYRSSLTVDMTCAGPLPCDRARRSRCSRDRRSSCREAPHTRLHRRRSLQKSIDISTFIFLLDKRK